MTSAFEYPFRSSRADVHATQLECVSSRRTHVDMLNEINKNQRAQNDLQEEVDRFCLRFRFEMSSWWCWAICERSDAGWWSAETFYTRRIRKEQLEKRRDRVCAISLEWNVINIKIVTYIRASRNRLNSCVCVVNRLNMILEYSIVCFCVYLCACQVYM